MKKENIISREYDLSKSPPKLTEKQKKLSARLAVLPDEKIDLSDIPELDNDFWKNAYRVSESGLYKPQKKSVHIYFDVDVIAWAKSKGKGYQTRLNAILRKAMLDELKHKH